MNVSGISKDVPYAATAVRSSRASLSTPHRISLHLAARLLCKDLHRGRGRYHRPARNRRGVPCGRPIRESPGNHKGCPYVGGYGVNHVRLAHWHRPGVRAGRPRSQEAFIP